MSRMFSLATLLTIGAAFSPACLRVEHGIVVELRVAPSPMGGASEVELPGGDPLALDAGEITIRDVTLLPCAASPSQVHAAAWGLPFVAAALAHDHTSAGRVVRGPFRVPLTEGETIVGVLTPPPGTYCGLHVNLGPESGEAEPAWTLRARAHARGGAELGALTDAVRAAHVVPAVRFDLTTTGPRTIHLSLYDSPRVPVGNVDPEDAGALGAALVGAAVAQSDAVLTSDAPAL